MVFFGWVIESKDDWSAADVANGVQNFLICVEMLPLAFAHVKSFGHRSYKDDAIFEINELLEMPSLHKRIWDAFNFLGIYSLLFTTRSLYGHLVSSKVES